jgi:hypothetical protein
MLERERKKEGWILLRKDKHTMPANMQPRLHMSRE